jgi:hypothetical protein
MNFDLRYPIGIMFGLFGLMLTIFGFMSDQEIYDNHSLGININLRWGLVLLVFGLFMLTLALRASRRPPEPVTPEQPNRADENLAGRP